MTDGVKIFLSKVGMVKYYDIFTAKGFDLESDIPQLTAVDLEESLMISCQRDRAIILSQAGLYQPSPEHTVYEWLRSNFLDHYFISFIQSELTDLKVVAQLQLPNEELYDELEITLPGHKKRLERAVRKLQQDQEKFSKAETPVTHGWWGKPECLPQAKFDFLCVKASLFASHEPNNKKDVDFMVDSGSDVSTVQEDTLKTLNLELLGSVYSCGIHGGNHTNLYKAQLLIGDQEMDIEIMASNYDSLGSRVVRNFRHVIDGHEHIWLKSNFKDHLPAVLPLPAPCSAAGSSFNNENHLATSRALTLPESSSSNSSVVPQSIQQQTENEPTTLKPHQTSNSGVHEKHLHVTGPQSFEDQAYCAREHCESSERISSYKNMNQRVDLLLDSCRLKSTGNEQEKNVTNDVREPHMNLLTSQEDDCNRSTGAGKGKRGMNFKGHGGKRTKLEMNPFPNHSIEEYSESGGEEVLEEFEENPQHNSSTAKERLMGSDGSTTSNGSMGELTRVNSRTCDQVEKISDQSTFCTNENTRGSSRDRISLINTVPIHLRDTHDDIDCLNAAQVTAVTSFNCCQKDKAQASEDDDIVHIVTDFDDSNDDGADDVDSGNNSTSTTTVGHGFCLDTFTKESIQGKSKILFVSLDDLLESEKEICFSEKHQSLDKT